MKPRRMELDDRLKNLSRTVLVPMVLFMLITLLLFSVYNLYYSRISGNIVKSSQFNQNFKDEIDLKMYYVAVESEFSEGIPLDEVDEALTLAGELLESTTTGDGRRAIREVINLCENLKASMSQLAQTKEYEKRIEQLESNIYVSTELIQYYVYNYLHLESRHLASAYKVMNYGLYILLAVVVLGMAILTTVTVKKQRRISSSITKPIDLLYSRVKQLSHGSLTPQTPVAAEDRKLQALATGFEQMTGQLNRQMELNRIEAERVRKMEFLLIQAQINPHFLYNTLDTIVWLIEMGQSEKAIDMITNLSDFFRLSLSNGRDVITLREEELHIRSYLEIQQVRYKDVLQYEIHMDAELNECGIPKLSLQPLVENALYHGIKLKRGGGKIKIESTADGDFVLLRVWDNGVGMTPERLAAVREGLGKDKGTGFGITAVYRRLSLMFGDRCDFTISSEHGTGTEVVIRIPRLTEAQNN